MAVIEAFFGPDSFNTGHSSSSDMGQTIPNFRIEAEPKTVSIEDILFTESFDNLAQTTPIAFQPQSVEAIFPEELETDWFNRIHLIPREIAAGAISGAQSRELQVWNAYQNPESIYEVLNSLYADGVSISGDIVTGFNSLEMRELSVDFDASGNPTIDSELSFVFNGETAVLPVSGVRISLLPYFPQTGSTETLEAKTWIFESKDGTEQRQRLRTKPVKNIKQSLLLTQSEYRTAQNIITGRVAERWAVIHAGEAVIINDSYAIDDTDVIVQTDYGEFYEGGLAIVWKSSSEYHLSTIETLDSNGFTFSTGFPAALSGKLFVAPVFVGRDAGRINVTTDPVGNHKVSLSFEIYTGEDMRGQVEDEYYQNYAFIDRENEGNNVSSVFTQNQYIRKSDFGIASWGGKWSVPKVKKDYKWTFLTAAELWWFRLFFYEHQGNVPFWVPSFEPDLLLSSSLGGSSVTLSVEDANFKADGSGLKNHIRITHPEGEDLREILSVADAGGGVSVLTLDAGTTNASTHIPAAVSIEFLSLVRFDKKISIKHKGYNSAASFSLIEVKQ